MTSVDGRIWDWKMALDGLHWGLKDGTEYISSIEKKKDPHMKLDWARLSQARLGKRVIGGGGGQQRVRR